MPKLISEAERQLTLSSIQKAGISLIRKKGIRCVTVDDVVSEVGIGKGSFYSYYSTKEEFLYDIVKRAEQKMVEISLAILNGTESMRAKTERILDQVYLAPDSLVLFVSPTDISFLMRKLPDKFSEFETIKSNNNFELFAELFHFQVTSLNYGTISYLMDGLQSIAVNPANYGEEGRKRSLKILIDAIADYLAEEMEQK